MLLLLACPAASWAHVVDGEMKDDPCRWSFRVPQGLSKGGSLTSDVEHASGKAPGQRGAAWKGGCRQGTSSRFPSPAVRVFFSVAVQG